MVMTTIGFGCFLIVLGVGAYFGTGRASVTAMIPAFVGLPMLLLGVAALKDGLRKYAMHGAVVLGVLGLVGASRGFKSLPALLRGDEMERRAAAVVQIAMALACLVFVVLCVLSFIKARRSERVDS